MKSIFMAVILLCSISEARMPGYLKRQLKRDAIELNLFPNVYSLVPGLTDPTPPVRPTFQEIGLKVLMQQEPFKWYQGHTADQTERDALEETAFGVILPTAIRFAKTIPQCSQAVKKAIGDVDVVTSRLGIGYEDASLRGNKDWRAQAFGRHYQIERYALEALQGCLTSSSSAALCASSPLATQNLLDALDLHIENAQCVKGSDVVIVPPNELYDPQRAIVDEINLNANLPPLTDVQMQALHATHMAHHQISMWRCNGGTKPDVNVDQAHQTFEASAVTNIQQHFFSMKRFSGDVDPAWDQGTVCRWALKQDQFHEDWMNAVMALDWRAARRADNLHQYAHLGMNLKGNFRILYPCGADNIFSCAKISQKAFLDQP